MGQPIYKFVTGNDVELRILADLPVRKWGVQLTTRQFITLKRNTPLYKTYPLITSCHPSELVPSKPSHPKLKINCRTPRSMYVAPSPTPRLCPNFSTSHFTCSYPPDPNLDVQQKICRYFQDHLLSNTIHILP